MWSKVKKNLLLMPLESQEKDFTQIEENLFLGNVVFAQNHHSMNKYDISLVISVYPKDLIGLSIQMIPPNCRFHHIDAKDSANEDLISHFDQCFDLINEELSQNDGKVLIYCGAGFSRSVTIMAAYLMKKHRISSVEAVDRIRSLRPRINPNPGFVAQLALYEEMDYHLDKTNREFRVFSMITLKKQIWTEKYWADSRVADLNRRFCEPMRSYFNKMSLNGLTPTEESRVYYRCLNCNHNLFEDINVLLLNESEDSSESPQITQTSECDNIFIEPIKWLSHLLCNNKSGDIMCPKCDQFLGSFQWKTFKCKCISHKPLKDSKVIKMLKSSVKMSSNN